MNEQNHRLSAKPIVKNKFWIVEEDGKKVATVQAVNKKVMLVNCKQRMVFDNLKELEQKFQIKFIQPNRNSKPADVTDIMGFPTSFKPYNVLYDLKKRCVIFTRGKKSRSYYCAGWFLICYDSNWVIEMTPKKIFIDRNHFYGPYKTKEAVLEHMQILKINIDKEVFNEQTQAHCDSGKFK